MAEVKREFTIELDGVTYPVVAEGQTITVNGRPFTVEVTDDGAVLVDGIVYDVTFDGEAATVDGTQYPVQVSGLTMAPVGPPLAAAGGPTAAPVTAVGAGAVLAIMPGKIIRVMVEVGQTVEEGEAVCVLEAMKMENELHAGRGGVVKAVHVQPGADVEKGQVLVEIE